MKELFDFVENIVIYKDFDPKNIHSTRRYRQNLSLLCFLLKCFFKQQKSVFLVNLKESDMCDTTYSINSELVIPEEIEFFSLAFFELKIENRV